MRALLFAALFFVLSPAWAQVPTISSVLGYEPGDRFAFHAEIVRYVEAVQAAAPDRVRIERYGTTYEGRPLMVVMVSSPQNMARLEDIRRSNLARAGQLDAPVLEDQPSLVWMAYNVHGNEAVTSEAALVTLYDLLTMPEASAWLENTVVMIDPAANPDGRDRYAQWYAQVQGRFVNPAPEAWEHREPWPGGRPNHYLFDLNRDWAWQTQLETRSRVALYQRWMPHIYGDFHEMGLDSPYFFPPPAEPQHAAVTPWQQEIHERLGAANARRFDASGRLYYTAQRFDLLYPAYGDTWPTYNGAIGVTYEQGGSGRAGLAIVNAEGDTLTLKTRIENMVKSSHATVEVGSVSQRDLVQNFQQFFSNARSGQGAPYGAYVVRGPEDRLRRLGHLLQANNIRYGFAQRERTVRGRPYGQGPGAAEQSVTVRAGDVVIPARQNAGVMVRVLFEPETALADSLSYDITAWALPYAFNLEGAALTAPLEPDAWALAQTLPAMVPPAEAPYAYVLPWNMGTARVMAALARRGVAARVAYEAFEQAGQSFAAGSLVITRHGNPAHWSTAVVEEAQRENVRAVALASGRVTSGSDLGEDGAVPRIGMPRVAVLAGSSTSSLALGEVWHFFDERLGYPVTLIDAQSFGPELLPRYDVIVMPSGNYGRVLNDENLGALRTWVRAGGRIVALEGALSAFAGKEGWGLARSRSSQDTPDPLRTFGGQERRAISNQVPGAIFRVALDTTHPLGFGYPEGHTYALIRSGTAFDYLAQGWNVGTLREGAHIAGFVGHLARPRLNDSMVFGSEDIGRGRIVYLASSPIFRGFWDTTHLIFVNAVFLP